MSVQRVESDAVTAAGRIHLEKEWQFRLYIPEIFSCKKEVTGI